MGAIEGASTTTEASQKEWFTAEEASALTGRSQIAMRALIQTALEDDTQKDLVKARNDEAAGTPFSFYLHRSLLENGHTPVVNPASRVEAPAVSFVDTQAFNELHELRAEVGRLQQTIEHQASQIHDLKHAVRQSQDVRETAPIDGDWMADHVASTHPIEAAVQEGVSEQPSTSVLKPKEQAEKKDEGSMTYLWIALGIVTLFALGAAYVVFDKLDKLPAVLQIM